jgi:hypothetical protein
MNILNPITNPERRWVRRFPETGGSVSHFAGTFGEFLERCSKEDYRFTAEEVRHLFWQLGVSKRFRRRLTMYRSYK